MFYKTIHKVKVYWKSTENPILIDWLLLGIIMAFLFFSFLYGDILVITSQSVTFDNCLFSGRIMDFYKDSYHMFFNHVNNDAISTYDAPIFLIFGLWDIPLWIANKFFNVDIMNSIPSLIWIKLFLILSFACTCLLVYKICRQMKMTRCNAEWAVFLYASSATVLSSLFMIAQADIVSVLFTLLGILMFLKKKTRYFILFFAIAISLKLFAFFIFIPLLLLREKKIVRVILYSIAGASLELASKLVFYKAPYFKESTAGYASTMFSWLWSSTIPANFGGASIFAILLIFACVFAYVKQDLSEEMFDKFTIYIPALVYASFFAFVNTHPYWIIILSPFIAISIMQNMKFFKINMLLDMIYANVFLLVSNLLASWVYSSGTVDLMKIIPTIYGKSDVSKRKYPNVIDLYNSVLHLSSKSILPLLLGCFVACTAAFLFINYPRENVTADNQYYKVRERSLIWLRTAVILPFSILMIVCYYWVR